MEKDEVIDLRFKDQYLVYNRKSTDDPENQKNSLIYQRFINLEYAERNGLPLATGLTIPGFCTNGIIDESCSAYKEDNSFEILPDNSIRCQIQRPKFLQMVKMIKDGQVKGVILLCWDRISRNDQDAVLIKKLIKLGCDIRFAEAVYEKNSSGDLHRDIDAMISINYSRIISAKVKDAQVKLRNERRCIYRAPIGYEDAGSDNKPVDPVRGPFVTRIFELYATGEWSYNELAKWGREQGFTKKSVRRRRTKEEIANNVGKEKFPRESHPIDRKTIEYILVNPFYIGKVWNGTAHIDSESHKPLIDKITFYKCQELRKKRYVSVHNIDKGFSPYRGLLKCTCGRKYSPYRAKGITYYRTRCEESCTNPDKNLTETDVHDLIQAALDSIHFTDDELKEIEGRTQTELASITKIRDKELGDLRAKRQYNTSNLNYLANNKLTLLRTGAMTMEGIKIEEERLNQKIASIDKEITAFGESAQEICRSVITFSELVKHASLYYKFALDTEKREIVTHVFSELVFCDRKLVKLSGKEGFDALLTRNKMPFQLLGSGGRIRTYNLFVNSEPRYRCATPEWSFKTSQ